jgi:hypothetical protein
MTSARAALTIATLVIATSFMRNVSTYIDRPVPFPAIPRLQRISRF